MRSAIGNVCSFKSLLPCFFDIDAAEGSFAGKDEELFGIAILLKFCKFLDDGLAKSNASGSAIFTLFDEGDFVCEVDMSPF